MEGIEQTEQPAEATEAKIEDADKSATVDAADPDPASPSEAAEEAPAEPEPVVKTIEELSAEWHEANAAKLEASRAYDAACDLKDAAHAHYIEAITREQEAFQAVEIARGKPEMILR